MSEALASLEETSDLRNIVFKISQLKITALIASILF